MKIRQKLKSMILMSLFAAVMCIFAPFTVPLGPVPLSLSTFVLYLTSIILGKKAVISIIVYIIIGVVGLPVFSGGIGGLDRLLGPTGGFILGYIPCAVISGVFADEFKNKFSMMLVGLFVGTVAMYIPGVLWMLYILGADSLNSALSVVAVNILPFIPIDIIKMLLATFVGYRVKERIYQ